MTLTLEATAEYTAQVTAPGLGAGGSDISATIDGDLDLRCADRTGALSGGLRVSLILPDPVASRGPVPSFF